jgi:hypothetical protein
MDAKETAVSLPFTRDEFFDLFAAFNAEAWPVLIALWLASAVVSVRLFSARRPGDRVVSALLAAHWAWSGFAYHAAFFTSINPAAWIFATLFLVQAALFVWMGIVRRRLSFVSTRNGWTPIAWLLIVYSLLYPAINAAQHLTFSRIPTFGVPCPTTIFTAGLLMLAAPRAPVLALIPVLWSLVGGSAAVLLDVRADFALPAAGIVLAIFSMRRGPETGTFLAPGTVPRDAAVGLPTGGPPRR